MDRFNQDLGSIGGDSLALHHSNSKSDSVAQASMPEIDSDKEKSMEES